LIPWVNRTYPTDPANSSYFGYSAGGTFGLYTLFTAPETFQHYIIGSPGTSYDGDNFGIELANTWLQSGKRIDTRLFMSVGENEEFKRGFAKFDLVSGYYRLARLLRNTPIPGLEVTLRTFPEEIHSTAWTAAFTHGVRALLGPAGPAAFLPAYMQQS